VTNPFVFREYDIRGSSFSDITPSLAYKIGFYFSSLYITSQNNIICVARDGRKSSLALYEALSQGIIDAGGCVLDIGLAPTPLLYFADFNLKPAASIMITASHNPKDDNGFKMLGAGLPFFGKQIQELYSKIAGCKMTNRDSSFTSLRSTAVDLTDQYLTVICKGLLFKSDLKIAWDPGGGASCDIIKKLLQALPGIHITINSDIDGDFSGRPPDPTNPDNLHELIDIVRTQKCDFGVALDGDGDRICIITGQGKSVEGDQLLCLFARDILEYEKNRAIVVDIKTSRIVLDQIRAYGGVPIMCNTGHVFVKKAMRETKAVLGGEISGHIFFADKYYGYDDGIYAALRLIDLISRKNIGLDKMLKVIPKTYNTREIRIPVAQDRKFSTIDRIKEHLIQNNINFNDTDGVRVETQESWWLIRASNTESMLTIRCEATTGPELAKVKSYVENLILTVKSIDYR
jgi:phosphomannomutase